MREMEVRAKDKKVQKMGRDGLVERNLAKGTEERVSSREADFAFGENGDRQSILEELHRGRDASGRGVGERGTMRENREDRQEANEDRGAQEAEERARKARQDRSRRETEREEKDREREKSESTGADRDGRDEQRENEDGGGSRERDCGDGQAGSGQETGEGKSRAGKQDTEEQGSYKRQRKYERAERRAGRAGEKLKKAEQDLPRRRKLRYGRMPEDGARKRLHFEQEIIPEHEKKPLPKRMGKAVARSGALLAEGKVHQKIREAERDNIGVASAHKLEMTAEGAARIALHHHRERVRTRPYRAVRRAESRMMKAESKFAYEKFLKDNPDMDKKAFSKWLQKQRIKRQYAAAARAAAKGGKTGGAAAKGVGKAVEVLKKVLPGKKTVALVAVAVLLLFSIFGPMLSTCTAMFSGLQSAVVSACYPAEEGEICAADLYYTEMETDLRVEIGNTETDYPGYDEYRYEIGSVGHDGFMLISYLSAVFQDFSFADVEAELERLFGLQYELTREESVEVRTRIVVDEAGEEQEEEYDWTVLTVRLEVTAFADVVGGLLSGEELERYGIYMQTGGGRQMMGNPIGYDWLSSVTSGYGYRIHPVSGDRNLHRGLDIGAAEGTSIYAAQDGAVVSAGEAGNYGLCVVIDGGDGYVTKYAHCSSVLVSAGQTVKRGDVIARVGSTGVSTGPHLHLEVLHGGEYLNPLFFVERGW